MQSQTKARTGQTQRKKTEISRYLQERVEGPRSMQRPAARERAAEETRRRDGEREKERERTRKRQIRDRPTALQTEQQKNQHRRGCRDLCALTARWGGGQRGNALKPWEA